MHVNILAQFGLMQEFYFFVFDFFDFFFFFGEKLL